MQDSGQRRISRRAGEAGADQAEEREGAGGRADSRGEGSVLGPGCRMLGQGCCPAVRPERPVPQHQWGSPAHPPHPPRGCVNLAGFMGGWQAGISLPGWQMEKTEAQGQTATQLGREPGYLRASPVLQSLGCWIPGDFGPKGGREDTIPCPFGGQEKDWTMDDVVPPFPEHYHSPQVGSGIMCCTCPGSSPSCDCPIQ